MGEDIRHAVCAALDEDHLAVEFQLGLFSAALLSYRKDTCLRPFPDFLQDGNASSVGKNMELLESIFAAIPPLHQIKNQTSTLSEDCWNLLHWIVKNKTFSSRCCGKQVLKDLQEKTGQSSFALEPDYIFEIEYHTNASQKFDELSSVYGLKYGYHGSRMDNFYSIVSNGLQVHMMKNGLFGEGIYLSEDLAVTMPYVSGGHLWEHSNLGQQASCVAVCEILNHPGVKCQVDNDEERSKKRAIAKNSELGEVPDKYFVVTSSELIRIKYLLVFIDKHSGKRKKADKQWICFRYPVASILLIYLLFLIFMGLWKSRTVQQFWNKHWRTNYLEND